VPLLTVAYNAECRSIVMKYAADWETTVTRMGRWIDFKNDYKTLNPTFMESVWWVFKQLYEKDQVYRGFKVWCCLYLDYALFYGHQYSDFKF
jgi:isoleucyl-tRNA synthetase